jgi:hypothetical protein
MTAEATVRRTGSDHYFFIVAGAAAFAVVFIGFARTYYLKSLFGTPSLSWLVHLHGFLMTAWFALFFLQVRLVAAHRVDLHRRVGVVGGALAALMVIVGVTMARRLALRNLHNPNARGHPLQFTGFILFVLLVFAILVGAALLLRRRRDCHRRLMLLSCLALVGPGLSRIPIEHVPIVGFLRTGGPFGLFGLDLLLVYACVAYDTLRNHRLHPAFALGAALMTLEDLPFIGMFLSSARWMHVATWFVS